MGFKLEVPAELATAIMDRHGNPIYIVAKRDWKRIRRITKKNKKVYEELKDLDVKLTEVLIRNGDGLMAENPLSRKRKR